MSFVSLSPSEFLNLPFLQSQRLLPSNRSSRSYAGRPSGSTQTSPDVPNPILCSRSLLHLVHRSLTAIHDPRWCRHDIRHARWCHVPTLAAYVKVGSVLSEYRSVRVNWVVHRYRGGQADSVDGDEFGVEERDLVVSQVV